MENEQKGVLLLAECTGPVGFMGYGDSVVGFNSIVLTDPSWNYGRKGTPLITPNLDL